MKKLVLSSSLLLGITSFGALAHSDERVPIFSGQFCNDSGECEQFEIWDESELPQDITPSSESTNAKAGKGSGKKTFVEAAANATGKTINAVTGFLNGVRQTAIAAGYNRFEGKLSGPAGSISVDFNFETGAWAISGSGSSGHVPTHGQRL